MTIKELRDYLNALNLDEVQEHAFIVSDTFHEGERVVQQDGFEFVSLCFCDKHKPYLAFYTDSVSDFIDSLDDDEE